MKKEKEDIKVLKKLATDLLKNMGVDAGVEVIEDATGESLVVSIDSEKEKGLLIGKRGETIYSLQTALGLMLRQALGEWKRVVVNVGDWRERQEEYLGSLAVRTAERVKETGEAQPLYNLDPSQRKMIHLAVQDIAGVTSESTGEGKDRYLVIKPDVSK